MSARPFVVVVGPKSLFDSLSAESGLDVWPICYQGSSAFRRYWSDVTDVLPDDERVVVVSDLLPSQGRMDSKAFARSACGPQCRVILIGEAQGLDDILVLPSEAEPSQVVAAIRTGEVHSPEASQQPAAVPEGSLGAFLDERAVAAEAEGSSAGGEEDTEGGANDVGSGHNPSHDLLVGADSAVMPAAEGEIADDEREASTSTPPSAVIEEPSTEPSTDTDTALGTLGTLGTLVGEKLPVEADGIEFVASESESAAGEDRPADAGWAVEAEAPLSGEELPAGAGWSVEPAAPEAPEAPEPESPTDEDRPADAGWAVEAEAPLSGEELPAGAGWSVEPAVPEAPEPEVVSTGSGWMQEGPTDSSDTDDPGGADSLADDLSRLSMQLGLPDATDRPDPTYSVQPAGPPVATYGAAPPEALFSSPAAPAPAAVGQPVAAVVPSVVPTRRQGKGSVVAVWSSKGGVGKTTIALALAIRLRRARNARVAIVDLDIEAGDMRSRMGAKGAGVPNAYDLIQSRDFSAENVERFLWADEDGVRALFAPPSVRNAAAISSPVTAYRQIIEAMRELVDVVVLDCGESAADPLFAQVALGVATGLCVVIDNERAAVVALRATLDEFREDGGLKAPDRTCLVLNQKVDKAGVAEAQIRTVFEPLPLVASLADNRGRYTGLASNGAYIVDDEGPVGDAMRSAMDSVIQAICPEVSGDADASSSRPERKAGFFRRLAEDDPILRRLVRPKDDASRAHARP